MSTPSDPQRNSSTDRAVQIVAAVLLPTVFGFFVVRHLWLTPETTSQSGTTSPAVAGDSQRSGQNSTQAGGLTGPNVTVAMEVRPLLVHVLPATFDVDGIAEPYSSHAPLELSMVGRAIVDPRAFAPETLPERGQQALRRELQAAATELDLYGSALRPDNRFDPMKKEVTDKRTRLIGALKELSDATRLKSQKLRRARSPSARQAIERELSAEIEKLRSEIYGTNDPSGPRFEPLKNWLVGRDDLEGLPLAMGDECRLDVVKSAHLEKVSTMFRSARRFTLPVRNDSTKDNALLGFVKQFNFTEHDIPGLMQVLTAEKAPLRLELVSILSTLHTPESLSALARLATYDVASDVRKKAVAALDGHPHEMFRGEFLAGLRHVWPPAADNAAQALVSLDDRDAYNQLAAVARQSDPRAPYQTDDNQWAVHELVRVNHLRNCLLCHAPAVATAARVTGAVPSPYELPPVQYYQSNQGSDYMVRADVTYLRQDFSVVHAVENHGPWPAVQRYDYLVRERKLSEQEAAVLSRRFSNELYPQRVAVLFAMRKLRQDKSPGNRPLLSSAE